MRQRRVKGRVENIESMMGEKRRGRMESFALRYLYVMFGGRVDYCGSCGIEWKSRILDVNISRVDIQIII